MKCPICGEQLRPGKKDPNYLLCYNCRKKFKVPQKKASGKKRREPEEPRYSNIPPKAVRKKREDEMKRAYDDMLAVGNGKKKKRRGSRDDMAVQTRSLRDYEDDPFEDDYEDEYEDKVSFLPVIVLGIAIVAVAAVIAYMVFFK